MRYVTPYLRASLVFVLLAAGLLVSASPLFAARQLTTTGPNYGVYLPVLARPAQEVLPTVLTWDQRLDSRMAKLVPAIVAPGQGYWKLVEGRWYDVTDPRPVGVGDCVIAVDVQDRGGVRQVNKALNVTWSDGQVDFHTEGKPGEKYAGSTFMIHVAPTYNIKVDDGSPSDEVDGLGLGTIQYPGMTIHTSYGLIWRWTVAGATVATPTPSVTPSPSVTPEPSATPTPPTAGITWDPRLDQLNAVRVPALVASGQGYWRLVKGEWYDVGEGPFPNFSQILVDTLDAYGVRQTGVPLAVSSNDGSIVLATLLTQAKPGELYATGFQMWELRPAYRIRPADGQAADMVYNLGQGTITQPTARPATSYGFIWQWTIAP